VSISTFLHGFGDRGRGEDGVEVENLCRMVPIDFFEQEIEHGSLAIGFQPKKGDF
jgi:hypothetical protein